MWNGDVDEDYEAEKSGWVKERQRKYRIVINPFPCLYPPI
jgi:hypothetical protein